MILSPAVRASRRRAREELAARLAAELRLPVPPPPAHRVSLVPGDVLIAMVARAQREVPDVRWSRSPRRA